MPVKFSPAEDAEVIRLKERATFSGWNALHAAWSLAFPASDRDWGTLQVRYSRYLNAGKKHRDRALAHLDGAAAAPPPAVSAPAPAAPAPAAPVVSAPPPPPTVPSVPAAAPAVPRPRPRCARTAPAAAGPSAAPFAVPTTGWREPPVDKDDVLSVHPVPGDLRRGIPRAPSAPERQRAHAQWEREFDADLEWMTARAGWVGSGAGRVGLLDEEIVAAPERAEGEVRRSGRKRKGAEEPAPEPKRRR